MTRRSNEEESSLELLLDTITNTFGGVLFIALLIVLLVRNQGVSQRMPEPDIEVVAQMVRLERQIERARTEIDTLDELLARQRERLTKQLDGVRVEEVVMLNDLKKRRDELLLKRLEGYQETVKVQQSINEKAKEFNAGVDLSGKIAQAKRDLYDLTNEIAKSEQENRKVVAAIETKSRSAKRDLKLPTQQRTSKKAIYVAIWRNRVFRIVVGGRLNTSHLVVTDSSRAQVSSRSVFYTFRLNRGLVPSASVHFERAMKTMLGNPAVGSYYVKIFVYDGSFKGFQHVRDVVVGSGLRYDAAPLSSKETIPFGSGGGGSSFAQ